MQALILAAGMGKRLGKYTHDNTKCMVEVNGVKLIDRAISAIKKANINKIIIVIGYKGENLQNYLENKYKDLELVFINNKDYATTNNIYSFYMAKDYLLNDDTILLESDLIFEDSLIKDIVQDQHETLAVVAKYKNWMDGTVVTLSDESFVTEFIEKSAIDYNHVENLYKTVNIYKFSKDFFKNTYLPFLEAYIKVYGLNSYYETALKVVAFLFKSKIYGYDLKNLNWYEIDDAQDLDVAQVLFSDGGGNYDLLISKFGGYWRYNKIIDFCYLVNPYFPTKSFLSKLQVEFPKLISSYPSGLAIQRLNAERIFSVDENYILVGNGAAELINCLGKIVNGKVAVGMPTFNEYIRCFTNSEIIKIDNSKFDYAYSLETYMKYCEDADVLCIVSPDNPSGAMLSKNEALKLCEHAKKHNTMLVLDESFIDFADSDKKYTMLCNEILEKYPNLVVVKSIGKSYGVAGLRLGVLASSDAQLLQKIQDNMAIWNINSLAEYYLQTYNIYAKDYASACGKIVSERNYLTENLNKIKGIKVYPSQANFLMVDLGKTNSNNFCVEALSKFDILIKDLSTKQFFKGKNFVRIAIKNREENDILLDCFKKLI